MNEFVEQCRKEWERLRVPESIANEMAADLDADLEEARAEGTSAEDVLGRDAFDPRAFATKWAAARGVIPPALAEIRPARTDWIPRWRPAAVVALVVSGLVALLGAALAVHHASTSRAFAAPVWRSAQPPPFPMMQVQAHGGFMVPAAFGVFLLLVGIAGVVLAVYWWTRNNNSSGPSYS